MPPSNNALVRSIHRNDKLAVADRRRKMEIFVDQHRRGGNVGQSCDAAGIGRSLYYWWLERSSEDLENPNPDFCIPHRDTGEMVPFVMAVAEAREDFIDVVQDEIKRRAVDGWEEPVFGTLGTPEFVTGKNGQEREVVRKYTGQIATVKKHSDLLLMFYMKALRPAEYRENVKVEHEHKGKVEIDSARDRLAAKLLQAIERKQAAADAEAQLTIDTAPIQPALPESGQGSLETSHVRSAREASPASTGQAEQPGSSQAGTGEAGRIVTMHPGQGESPR